MDFATSLYHHSNYLLGLVPVLVDNELCDSTYPNFGSPRCTSPQHESHNMATLLQQHNKKIKY